MRKENSLKNFITSTVPFIILIFLGFWKVNVWQNSLDADTYAINQLFFQLFAYLSLAEAGIGALVLKEYYRLFVENDKEEICIYYTLSKKMLQKVCYVVMFMGVILSFFLKFLANDNQLSLIHMQKIFLLFLAKSLVEYFMFSPRFVLQADQKLHKINLQMNFYKIVESILETVLIMLGVSYASVLIMSFILRIIMNLHLNRIVFQEYPWLTEVQDTKHIKISGMQHVLIYKIVSVIHQNVDLLLISSFVNPFAVIVYSNYKYITKYVDDLLYQVGSSLTSSLGNLLNAEKNEKGFYTYEMISTMFYFLATFLTVSLTFCINPFMKIWVGDGKLFDRVSLICMMFLFYHGVVRKPQYILKDIFGLYKELQMVSIAEAIINFVLSLILVQNYGISGVLVASVLAMLVTNFWYFPLMLYRKIFDKSIWLDMGKYVVTTVITVAMIVLSFAIYPSISSTGYIIWFLQSVVYAGVVLIVLGGVFYFVFKSFRRLVNQCLELATCFLTKGEKKYDKEI